MRISTDHAPGTNHQDTASQAVNQDGCDVAQLLSSASHKLGAAYEQLQTEVFEREEQAAPQEIKTVSTYLIACITQLQVELTTIHPSNTMSDLGTAWLKVTDLQEDLERAIHTLRQDLPESKALNGLTAAKKILLESASALEARMGHLFEPLASAGDSQPNRANAAVKVDYMLKSFKCFSQMDVTPCLEKLEQQVNSRTQDLLHTMKANLDGLEDALSTLLDASLFDDLPRYETQRIAIQISQLENQLTALKSSGSTVEQMDDYLSQLNEKLTLAAQSYCAFIA